MNNRIIKFRGKSVLSGELVYGSLVILTENNVRQAYIFSEEGIKMHINWDSVGQFTGLKDKNGVDIYEGDIVKYEVWERFHESVTNRTRVVDWNEKMCGWNPMCQHTDVEDGYYNWEIENVEVIGNVNVMENPELLTPSHTKKDI